MKTIARFQKHPGWMFFRLMMVLQVLVMFCEPALALPRGENVRHGEVKFKQDGDYLKIKQKSGKAIVEYNSFDIDRPETVEFVQPSKGSAILNRVVGGGASEIAGKLLANGMVYLINTNGILFTSSARVNVGALIASAMNMSDGDFLSGRMFFSGGNGTVTNKGSISGRSVYLVGGSVKNKGRISAREVVLGAGKDSVLIDTIAGGEIRLVIDGEETDAEGDEEEAGAEDSEEVTDGEEASSGDEDSEEDAEGDTGDSSNDEGDTSSDTEEVVDVDEEVEEVVEDVNLEIGRIVNEGQIVLKGKKGGNIVVGGTQVDQMGKITADGVKAGGGTIRISAEEKVTIAQDSVTSAKALKKGVGGVIVIEGEEILIEAGSLIDGSGIDGGGIIRIGGGFQGKNKNI
ncbi:MAG: filamentous hemagglutinin N-terminal domain-containing protein, partial [Candidatus Theseobacter exili]|nr:filamentous hemagglutinin N-terminal domain-containing protein [Candidatus Theseobacter exili]